MALYGAVEAGGTKFMCAVGEDPARLERLERIETFDKPAETMRGVVEYFLSQPPLAALGVACFGPLDLAGGRIGRTPKLAWAGFPMREALERELGVKVVLDTDVNGAAIGEGVAGAAVGCADFVYITVGTGIGGGAVSGGKVVRGTMHPEMGHIPVMRHMGERPGFPGHCRFHAGCLGAGGVLPGAGMPRARLHPVARADSARRRRAGVRRAARPHACRDHAPAGRIPCGAAD